MLLLVAAVPHRAVREPHAANRLPAVNRQPDFHGRIFLSMLPTYWAYTVQSLGQHLGGIRPAVAVLALHLCHKSVCGFAVRLRMNSVVDAQKLIPVSAPRPVSDPVEVC